MAWNKARVELRRLVRCELIRMKGWEGGSGWEEDWGGVQMWTPIGCRLPFVLDFGFHRCMLLCEEQLLLRVSLGSWEIPFPGR